MDCRRAKAPSVQQERHSEANMLRYVQVSM
jgi:hypothetical protein